MVESTRVLLTGGEEVAVLGATRALSQAGFETWVVSRKRGSFAARSRAAAGAVVLPDAAVDTGEFAEELARVAAELSVAAVLPGTESALIALAGRESLFPAGVVLGVPAADVVERALDKLAFLESARRAGLETPSTVHIRADELTGPTAPFPLPAVVKPLRSEQPLPGGKLRHLAPRLVTDLASAKSALTSLTNGEGLVQPFVPGEIYGFCAVAWGGRLVCGLHQIGERVWPRDCGMVSYARTVPRDDALEASVARVLEELSWSGIFQIQFIRHRGRLLAIDLNPRVYISIALATAAGMNLPAIWTRRLLGRDPDIADYRVGVRWRSDQDDPRAIAGGLVRGNRLQAMRGLVPHRETVHAVFSREDPAPFVESLRSLVLKPLKARRRFSARV